MKISLDQESRIVTAPNRAMGRYCQKLIGAPGFDLRVLWLCLTICAGSASLLAQANDRTIAQFGHTSWSAKEGAPSDVYALAQTTDGFLWLGTTRGLYRFDGIGFELYEPQSGPPFTSKKVRSLLALPNGDLWIGFREKGISRLRNGNNTNYTDADGLPSGTVLSLAQDREGAIWAGTLGGLVRFGGERWQRVGSDWGYPEGIAQAVYCDRQGTLWVAANHTVLFRQQGARKFQTTGIDSGQIMQFVESPGGMLWMAETSKSVHPVPFPANLHGFHSEIRVGSAGVLFDDDGTLWITTIGDGMRRVPYPDQLQSQKIAEFSDAMESFTAKDGLSGDYATCILKDREGDIWVGTSAGLDRFRKGAVIPLRLPAQYTQKMLVAGNDGKIWVVGSSAPLTRTEGTRLEVVPPRTSAGYGFRDPHGTVWFLRVIEPMRILRAEERRLRVVGVAPVEFRRHALGKVLAQDRNGTLWLGNGPHSLFFFKGGRWQEFQTPSEVAGKQALITFADIRGRLWFGFSDNTILVLDGTNVRVFSAKDGIQVGNVSAITGRDHHIWIGGDNGLAVWDEVQFRTLFPLNHDGVSAIQEDAEGNLFVGEARGIVFIRSGEVLKILKDPSANVQYQIFDERDGLPGGIQQTPPYPTSVQSTDGRIWFSTPAGVAWIDPAHIPRNLLPPPVVIRSITANGTGYTSPAGLKLPPRTRDLAIDYTALSLAIPDRVRFRYKLEGSDTQWQDAGTRRQAFYTNLSPGHYLFRVTASNNDRVWNEAGASLTFLIAPAWYQTVWFRILCATVFLVLLWGIYRLRIQQLQHQFAIGLEARVNERTRIARELHDTLLQSFHGLMFQFQAASNLMLRRPDEAKRSLDDAIEETKKALTESRDAIQELRSEPTAKGNLAELLMSTSRELAVANGNEHQPVFDLIEEGERRTLSPTLSNDISRIALELMRNAYQHAHASRIEAEIRYGDSMFRLRIRDDGKGIEPKVLKEGGKVGHWGLRGVRERADRIGAHLGLWSEPGSGTEVQLLVPASAAYESFRDSYRAKLVQKIKSRAHRS